MDEKGQRGPDMEIRASQRPHPMLKHSKFSSGLRLNWMHLSNSSKEPVPLLHHVVMQMNQIPLASSYSRVVVEVSSSLAEWVVMCETMPDCGWLPQLMAWIHPKYSLQPAHNLHCRREPSIIALMVSCWVPSTHDHTSPWLFEALKCRGTHPPLNDLNLTQSAYWGSSDQVLLIKFVTHSWRGYRESIRVVEAYRRDRDVLFEVGTSSNWLEKVRRPQEVLALDLRQHAKLCSGLENTGWRPQKKIFRAQEQNACHAK
jgi:hypothetical protein